MKPRIARVLRRASRHLANAADRIQPRYEYTYFAHDSAGARRISEREWRDLRAAIRSGNTTGRTVARVTQKRAS